MLKAQLSQGTPPDKKNIRQETPLWIAAWYGHEEVAELLLQTNDVDVNSRCISDNRQSSGQRHLGTNAS